RPRLPPGSGVLGERRRANATAHRSADVGYGARPLQRLRQTGAIEVPGIRLLVAPDHAGASAGLPGDARSDHLLAGALPLHALRLIRFGWHPLPFGGWTIWQRWRRPMRSWCWRWGGTTVATS